LLICLSFRLDECIRVLIWRFFYCSFILVGVEGSAADDWVVSFIGPFTGEGGRVVFDAMILFEICNLSIWIDLVCVGNVCMGFLYGLLYW